MWLSRKLWINLEAEIPTWKMVTTSSYWAKRLYFSLYLKLWGHPFLIYQDEKYLVVRNYFQAGRWVLSDYYLFHMPCNWEMAWALVTHLNTNSLKHHRKQKKSNSTDQGPVSLLEDSGSNSSHTHPLLYGGDEGDSFLGFSLQLGST